MEAGKIYFRSLLEVGMLVRELVVGKMVMVVAGWGMMEVVVVVGIVVVVGVGIVELVELHMLVLALLLLYLA